MSVIQTIAINWEGLTHILYYLLCETLFSSCSSLSSCLLKITNIYCILLWFLLSCQLLSVAFQELSLWLLIIIIFLVQLAIWNVCLDIDLKYILYLLIVEDYAAVLSNDYTVMVDFD